MPVSQVLGGWEEAEVLGIIINFPGLYAAAHTFISTQTSSISISIIIVCVYYSVCDTITFPGITQ